MDIYQPVYAEPGSFDVLGHGEIEEEEVEASHVSSSNAVSENNNDTFVLPAGAVRGRCPEGSDGQDVLVWVDHVAEQGGNNIAGASEGVGAYIFYCFPDVEEVSGEPIVISVSVEEFRRLPLAGSGIVIEPDRDDYIIRLPVIGLTDPSAQVLTTTIVGINVAVRATPVEYSFYV
ncbi:hypothetical protein [Jonesia quinghaiensis]|uniref:hypothetical protein n=1 Tax=Jonesia quinghaiensis TaxID=262806 RepID=UPI0004023DB2|nr:hypothetical protein [Jonesia quinghaiensis]